MGQRVIKEVDGVSTVFHYDFNGNIIAESDLDGNFNTEYLYNGKGRVALVNVSTEEMFFFLNDRLGTPQMLTDASNTVVWEGLYKPFGGADVNPNSSVVNNFRFPGQYYDNETGLHYNYFRYYDPATGRYLTPDPIGLVGGINLWIYANGNPINAIDPWGLQTTVMPGGATGPFPAGHPVFQSGTYENQLIANDLTKLIGLMDPRPLARDIADLFGSEDEPYCEAKGSGDPPIIYDPNDLGPLFGAPGLPGWKNPASIPPEDPDRWKKPNNWKNMSKWEKFKWYFKKATMSGGSAGGVG